MSVIETKPQAAVSMWELGQNIANLAGEAVTELSSDVFTKAMQDVPRYCKTLIDEVTRLHTKGWTAAVLGPVIFDLVDGDPSRSWDADYSADYDSFKMAVLDYSGYVSANDKEWGTIGFDAELRPEMRFTANALEKSELITKLQSIADSFPTVPVPE